MATTAMDDQLKTEDVPPNHTIYVKNLNEKIKLDRLKETLYASFSAHGKVLEIQATSTYKMRGQAWITFDDIASASNALRAMNGFVLFEKPLVIHFAKEKADVIARREGTYKPREKRKLEVKEETSVKKEKSAPSTSTANGSNGHKHHAPPPPPPPAQNLPNKILFLQELPESCNDQMLSVLFKQYHGFKVRWPSMSIHNGRAVIRRVLTRELCGYCYCRKCEWCRARRVWRSWNLATMRRPRSLYRVCWASSSRPLTHSRSRSRRSSTCSWSCTYVGITSREISREQKTEHHWDLDAAMNHKNSRVFPLDP
jgi:U2 small nuclear ribonucleoprotein B''